MDILVNNPSGFVMADDEAAWQSTLGVDVMAAVRASARVAPWMGETGGGVIIHISSIAGLEATGFPASYCASKAALVSHAKSLAFSLASQKIRVNTVAPGHVMTPHAMSKMPESMRESRRKVGALGIEGDAWDVAQAVVFVASDEARCINGVHLAVDGGVEGIGPMTGHAFISEP